jgi:heptosyltransferase-2
VTDRKLDSLEFKRVVVRGANWVGDAVMTVPALRELRRVLPLSHITLATRQWARGIFEGADFIDEFLLLDGGAPGASFFGQVRMLRRGSFDLAILFPNAFEPALAAFAARIPARIGYATDGRGMLLTRAIPVPSWRGKRHEVFYYLNVIAALERMLSAEGAAGCQPAAQPTLEVSEQRRQTARSLLASRGVQMNRPVVALCPGSTNSRAKRWPAERFAALGDMLKRETEGTVVLIGAREEKDVSAEVAAKMETAPLVLTGETSLDESASILSLCDLLVTNDTGPAHLAVAVGCPTVVIFGPTDPVTTRPFSDSSIVVREPPDCAPCMLRDCPIDHRCMTAIHPADVFARSMTILRGRVAREAVR